MLKKNLKLFAILLIVLTIISSFSLCFAEETNETTTDVSTTTEETSEDTSEEEIYEGDLYLFDSNVVMDQLVDGNVYIMGNNITISGQVNGNLFVFGDSIKFDNCYVRYSIYACAMDIYYDGACNDLYVATQNLEMTYDSYVVRDVKAMSNNTILKAAIGRDVDLQTNSADFGSGEEVPIIYGNLRYSANAEKTFEDGIVEGDITYTANNNIIATILLFVTSVVTVLVIYALLNKFNPKCINKLKYSPIEILKAFGIGLLTIIIAVAIAILLFFTTIGINLALIILAILVLFKLLAVPTVTVFVTNLLKPVLKIEKSIIYYLVLVLVSVILCALTLIPFYVGTAISAIITVLGYGLIIFNFLPKKEISEEEIQSKLAAKEAKKSLKQEKKAEKAKLKEAKKSEKSK